MIRTIIRIVRSNIALRPQFLDKGGTSHDIRAYLSKTKNWLFVYPKIITSITTQIHLLGPLAKGLNLVRVRTPRFSTNVAICVYARYNINQFTVTPDLKLSLFIRGVSVTIMMIEFPCHNYAWAILIND